MREPSDKHLVMVVEGPLDQPNGLLCAELLEQDSVRPSAFRCRVVAVQIAYGRTSQPGDIIVVERNNIKAMPYQ